MWRAWAANQLQSTHDERGELPRGVAEKLLVDAVTDLTLHRLNGEDDTLRLAETVARLATDRLLEHEHERINPLAASQTNQLLCGLSAVAFKKWLLAHSVCEVG